ncbi:MAG: hypothetical protein JW795_18175 [Chitinivibrionales bacterium]|nr:hypothetical protein [Chitinivibrionales bacterium]
MERVTFIIEETDQSISCMLNPQNLVLKRTAGLTTRQTVGAVLTHEELSDNQVLITGGGTTEIVFDLLFDTAIAGSSIKTDDVRDLTSPFWSLAENRYGQKSKKNVPKIRFIWGKAWNIPGVIVSVAEKLERFSHEGVPQRSWLRILFLRVNDSPDTSVIDQKSVDMVDETSPSAQIPPLDENSSQNENALLHTIQMGDRLDQLAMSYYGSASLWRYIAAVNNIENPLALAGMVLKIIPLPGRD